MRLYADDGPTDPQNPPPPPKCPTCGKSNCTEHMPTTELRRGSL